jgi:uncharacterized membrane protein
MSSSGAGPGLTDSGSRPPTWVRLLLGLVLVLGGIVVLGDVALATTVSTLFIGAIAIGAGAFEIAHVFWTRGWGGLGRQVILGVLYLACGLALVSQPVSATLALTYVIGLVLVLSGRAIWGALIGILFLNPLAGMAIGAITGAGAGALTGSMIDYGIPDDFIKKLSETIPPGSSALFVLFRSVTEDKVLTELEPYKPRVLKTSLSKEQESKLKAALSKVA